MDELAERLDLFRAQWHKISVNIPTDYVPTALDRIESLALNFPCLRDAPGAAPWDADKLDEWVASGVPSHGEKCTARFLLAIWNPDYEWKSPKFDLMDALSVWDSAHHAAFLEWARKPWWA
jgi:hypothetical protein